MSRSGEEMREIKSGGGKTTFEIEIKIVEEGKVKSAYLSTESSGKNLLKKG